MKSYNHHHHLCLLFALPVSFCEGLSFQSPGSSATTDRASTADTTNCSTHTHQRLDAFGAPLRVSVTQISEQPPMLVLRNFVSTAERYAILWSARNHPSNTDHYSTDRPHRNGSNVSWMPHANFIGASLAASAADLLLPNTTESIMNEELQVVQYDPRGEFTLHHDGEDRILTVLYYLNGVAGTWFPLASGMQVHNHVELYPNQKEEAMQQASQREPGRDGILVATSHNNDGLTLTESNAIVPIQPGDAVVFYNYKNNNRDWSAIHAGLPATEEKWIATHWFHEKK